MNKNTKAALCILTEYGMGFRLIDKNTICTVHDGPFEEPLTQLVSATKRTVVISTISPFKVDEGSQVMLREFITDRNTGIAIGGFFIDEGSGSFGFKSGIYTGGREVTEDELMYHSGIGISAFGRYRDEICRALDAKSTPVKDSVVRNGPMYG